MLPIERTIIPDVIKDQQIISLPKQATVREAVQVMAERRIGAIPIVERGRLVGIFTERDVVFKVVAAGRDPTITTLIEVMTREPETLSPSDTVRDALDKMNAGHFRHLPVIAENRLVGIISVRDLYQSVLDQTSTDIILLAEGLLQG